MPRMTVTGESAWLVLDGQPEEIVLNNQSMPFSAVGDCVELPLGMLPARNTLTVRAEIEPSAIIEIRSGVRS